MFHRSGVGTFLAGCLAVGLIATTAPASAASMTETFALHGAKYAMHAMGSAKVVMVSKGHFHITVTAEGLPKPSALAVTPARKVYLAWAVDAKGKTMMGMGVVRLSRDAATGNYTGSGDVMLQTVTEVSITADQTPMQHTPTMPEVVVLASHMGAM